MELKKVINGRKIFLLKQKERLDKEIEHHRDRIEFHRDIIEKLTDKRTSILLQIRHAK